MWMKIILVFLLIIVKIIYGKLSGDHICQEEIRHTVNVTEYFIKNITIRSYHWCMNVPPRCSFYKVRQLNDSRIIEKVETKIVEKCCPGYEANVSNNSCVSICINCVNGSCNKNKCICHAGFSGHNCDTACEPTVWGVDCKHQCACERGPCDSVTGDCNVCPSGWIGTRCELPCPTGYYGNLCEDKCNCQENEICDFTTGACNNATNLSVNDKDYDVEESSTGYNQADYNSYETSTASNIDNYQKPTKSYSSADKAQKNILVFKNNGRLKPLFPINFNKTSTTDKAASSPVNTNRIFVELITASSSLEEYRLNTNTPPSENKSTFSHRYDNTTQPDRTRNQNIDPPYINVINDTNQRSSELMKSLKPSKAKVNEKEVVKNVTTEAGIFHVENYLSDEAPEESINHSTINRADLVSSVSVAAAVAVAIIIVAVLIVTANRCRTNRKKLKAEDQRNKPMPSVSFYTHSIFHTPLPDPPTLENPIFLSPIDDADAGAGSNDTPRIETRIGCGINLPNRSSAEPRDYLLYDHPPSTGSYRAASLPEPPESDKLCPLLSTTTQISEPLYDEIPLRRVPTPVSSTFQSSKSASLYMNTCGKTRF